jgi:hypothetical protein
MSERSELSQTAVTLPSKDLFTRSKTCHPSPSTLPMAGSPWGYFQSLWEAPERFKRGWSLSEMTWPFPKGHPQGREGKGSGLLLTPS